MTEMPTEKTCTECGKTKPLEDYVRSKKGKYGREAKCKACVYAKAKAKREADPEAARKYMREYMKDWYERNPGARKRIRDDNLGSVWAAGYRQRARDFGYEPVVETFTKERVVELYGDQCWHCKDAPFEELDHYPIPVGLGGHHVLTNVRPSCVSCNRKNVGEVRTARAAKTAAA